MIMKSVPIPYRYINRVARVFLTLISVMSILLCSMGVWAEAPETEKITFVSKRDGNAEIYIMNPDGSEQVNLTQHPAEDYDPAWAPNGKQILFSSDRAGGVFDLYLMDADGTNVQKVFKDNKYRRSPAWAPDSEHIVYAQGNPQKALLLFGARFIPSTKLTLYIATINGDSVEKLTDGFEPSWSPDGREIAFVVGGLKHTPLGILDLQTRAKKLFLADEHPWAASPVWSPQGDKIAFTKADQARFNAQGFLAFRKGIVYIANSDGTGLQKVTNVLSASDPTWAPRGNQLIYKARQGSFQIFKTELKGGNSVQLTEEGDNLRPDWFNPSAFAISPSVRSLTTTWGEIKAD